jgi:hypothetical protein
MILVTAPEAWQDRVIDWNPSLSAALIRVSPHTKLQVAIAGHPAPLSESSTTVQRYACDIPVIDHIETTT